MWLIAGTVPENNFPLYTKSVWENSKVMENLLILPDGRKLPINRGTTALYATAILACEAMEAAPPHLLLAGDCGAGGGSLDLYNWLYENIDSIASKDGLTGLTFHYIYPNLDAHNKLLSVLENLQPKPVIIADAGFMYVAKMSGYASFYDLFTPDYGELAFLADEKAPHPFYTRGFLLSHDRDVKELTKRALHFGNCPANMIIKGKRDYILCDGEILEEISEPSVPAMECIGGTGDIVTGLATAYLAAGHKICESALWAARTARLLAEYSKPNPAVQVATLINRIYPMLKAEEMHG